MMRILSLVAILMVVNQSSAAEPSGYAVHEWGVFRVNSLAEYANAELRAEWDDLPPFIYGLIKGRAVPQHWGALEIRRKPIVFFHADKPVQVRAEVAFPGGQAGVWYPATESPAVFGNQKQPREADKLVWTLGIKQLPDGWRPKTPQPPAVAAEHWINRIREVKSDMIFSRYSPNVLDVEQEKFLYYDGIFPQGKWLTVNVTKENVSLKSNVKHPMFDLMIVDRRNDGLRVGRVAELNAGEAVAKVEFTNEDTAAFTAKAATALRQQLTAAGLNDDEAASLVDLWKKEFFETPGLNLFYRLPQAEYDARLPLTLTPPADKRVRVGLVYHAHLEPDFAERIRDLAKQLDSVKFAERDAAARKLQQIGPAAMVELMKLREQRNLSAELRDRLDSLIKRWNVRDGYEKP